MSERRPSAVILVASTRAARGQSQDHAGPLLSAWLELRGYRTRVRIVPDGAPVGRALDESVVAQVDLVITTGGTGIAPTDRTPEQTRPRLAVEIPGIPEALRRAGADSDPSAVLSRGLAGIATGGAPESRTIIVNLPGNPDAVGSAIVVLDPLLDRLTDQPHDRGTVAR